MTLRRLARLFAYSTLTAIRDAIEDFRAAFVPTLELVLEEIECDAREEDERRRLVAIMTMTRPAAQKEGKLWN